MHQVGEAGEPELSGSVALSVEDVGGIEGAEVTVDPGVTVLRGRNATNRTSLLRALAAALGSDAASLRAGAETGRVELTVGDETCTRVFERTPDGVRTGGEPYLADPTVAEHFAFCFEENPARRAVEALDGDGGALRDVLMAPVDTDRIEDEIERLRAERADVDDELARLDELAAELPDLEARRTSLERELETARSELQTAEDRVAAIESELASDRSAAEVEQRLAALREARSVLEEARYDLETERETAAELHDDRSAVEAELERVEAVPDERLATLDRRLQSLRRERSSLETEIGELQSVIQFNEELLEERAELFEADDGDDGPPTERLLDADRTVDCWTCGSTVPAHAVETTLEHLRERRQAAIDRRGELGERLDELERERSALEARRERRRELRRRRESIDEELERVEEAVEHRSEVVAEREATVEELEAELAALGDGADGRAAAADDPTLEAGTGSGSAAEVDDPTGDGSHHEPTGGGSHDEPTGDGSHDDPTGDGSHDDPTGGGADASTTGDHADRSAALVERYREARDLAVRVDRLEDELADVESRVEEVETELQHRRELEDRREAIGEQVEELRTRVDRVERAAVEAFNEHVAAVLDVLDYDNLERVWIERRTEPVREDGRTVERRTFAHHVVRAGEDGTTFEDDVANLSESEREVIGLVVALAGYLVHDVGATVPFLLLDSLEAVDARRIARLVDYVADHAEYLLVALLPEDARALDDDYEYVDEV